MIDVMSENLELKSYFAQHPKMIGVLFTLILLASQVGTVAASAGSTFSGP